MIAIAWLAVPPIVRSQVELRLTEGLGRKTTVEAVEFNPFAIDATNLSTKTGEKAHVTLSFVSADRIATFKAQADVEPLVPAATGTFDLTKFSLRLLFPYYKDVLAVDVRQGSLDLAAHFALLPNGNVKLSEGVATIGDLAGTGLADPLLDHLIRPPQH